MDFFSKKKINLEKGKKLFFECKGNGWWLRRDLDDPYEYLKCNVPKEVEAEWAKDIEIELIAKIKIETNVSQIRSLFSDLVMLSGLSYENKANHFISYLGDNYTKLDTFTIIRFCEELKLIKRYSRYEKVQNTTLGSKIDEVVRFYANKLLSEPIIVDDSYKNSRHMQNYDFSDENIKKRIQDLLK